MADYQKNITNTVNVFGDGPSTKWGQTFGAGYTMTWGSDKWGEGTNSVLRTFIKIIQNSQASTWSFANANTNKVVGIGTLTPAMEMSSERLAQGIWNYVFVSDTTNPDDIVPATWTSGVVTDATFTSATRPTTSWSEL